METSFERSKAVYKSKIPEIQQTIEIIKLLISKKENDEPMITNYSISDTIYAKAEVDMSEEKVCLWIGANTMVEYTYAEAVALLEEQRQLSFQKLKEYEEDLNHLRSCSITVEVNMARLFNHSVKMKKLAEASASKN
jgi:prefoldin subunit 5